MPSGDTTAAIHVQHNCIDELVPGQREDSISEIISTPYPSARQPRTHLTKQAGTILFRQEAPDRGINNAWGVHRLSGHAASDSRRTGLGRALRCHGRHLAAGRPTPGLCRRNGDAIARLWSSLLCAESLDAARLATARCPGCRRQARLPRALPCGERGCYLMAGSYVYEMPLNLKRSYGRMWSL